MESNCSLTRTRLKSLTLALVVKLACAPVEEALAKPRSAAFLRLELLQSVSGKVSITLAKRATANQFVTWPSCSSRGESAERSRHACQSMH
eukprot:3554927-Amphidinium_carterae.1